MSAELTLLLVGIAVVVLYFMFVPQVSKPEVQLVTQDHTDAVDGVGDYASRSWIENKFHVGSSRDEAAIRTNEALSAEAINRKNTVVRAEQLRVSVESIKQMEVIKFTTDEKIREYGSIKAIDVRVKKLEERIRLMMESKDAMAWLEISKKVALLEKEIEAIHGRDGQKAISEADSSELGADVAEAEDE